MATIKLTPTNVGVLRAALRAELASCLNALDEDKDFGSDEDIAYWEKQVKELKGLLRQVEGK